MQPTGSQGERNLKRFFYRTDNYERRMIDEVIKPFESDADTQTDGEIYLSSSYFEMSAYYTFYRPRDMKIIDEGHLLGMPFFWDEWRLPTSIVMYPDDNSLDTFTGIMNRETAEALQSVMTKNKTLFTDMMDECGTECLIFKVT